MTVLGGWGQCSLLPVESDRLQRWYAPELPLIGDAAQVFSPVGGVGINLAIQDAVAAAQALAGRPPKTRRLRAVQRRREIPMRLAQAARHHVRRWVVADALRAEPALRTPVLRDAPARTIVYGAGSARAGRRPLPG